MSLNASIKKGKEGQESDLRLTSMIGGSNRQKKENMLKKKRTAPSYLDTYNRMTHSNYTKEDVENHISNISDTNMNPCDVIESVQFFRKILSNDQAPPIELVISTGLVPRFTYFLSYDNIPELQYEAAWVLTNIASGTKEQTSTVVDSGALPQLIRLVDSPDMRIKEQVVWALGNIAGDNYTYRDGITNSGVIDQLLVIMQENHSNLLERNTVWLFSNLCRTRDDVPADFSKVCSLLPFLHDRLQSDDEQVVTDALWGFVFITDSNVEQARQIALMGATPQLIFHLSSNNSRVITPALRAVGNLLAGPDDLTQVCIEHGVIAFLEKLMMSSNNAIVKEALWCMSNIAAGNTDQIQLLLNDNIIPIFVELAQCGRNDIKKECCWCLCNMICGGNADQIREMVEKPDIVKVMAMCLTKESEERLIMIITDSMARFMRMGENMHLEGRWDCNRVEEWMEEYNMLAAYEELDLSESLYEKVDEFLSTYFEQDTNYDSQFM